MMGTLSDALTTGVFTGTLSDALTMVRMGRIDWCALLCAPLNTENVSAPLRLCVSKDQS